ncbi:MAG: S9 family peptidase [Acidobacteriota bacterium]
MRRTTFLTALLSLTALTAGAASPPTLDQIYNPAATTDFSKAPSREMKWIDSNRFLFSTSGDADTSELTTVEANTGKRSSLFNQLRLQKALEELSGVDPEIAHHISHRPSFSFDSKQDTIVLSVKDDLYLYKIASGALTQLTNVAGTEEEPEFSPDGKSVAFVRGNDLYVISLADGRERRLTSDGSNEILNGKLDWVYQEEIYGRGTFRAFWWSPDSSRLAYLQLDENPVFPFTIVDHLPFRQGVEIENYPKAGDPNPVARLFIAQRLGGTSQEVTMDGYPSEDRLLVDVAWRPDGSAVVYEAQNREQTWLDVNAANPASGSSVTLFRESTKAWVDRDAPPMFLRDGSMLWLSERDGWKHIYHYSRDGKLLGQVTRGEWEVRKLHGVDDRGWIYFSGTERSSIGSDVYRVRLDGSALKRLSEKAGTHDAEFSPDYRYYLDRWSDVTTPTQLQLYSSDGKLVRVVDANPLPLHDYLLSQPQFLTVKTRDGFEMNAMLIKPANFDPSRKYPVYEQTYSGPHAPEVKNVWRGKSYMFHQMLAQKGFLVWICDNRTASGKGAVSAWPLYRNFGPLELRDLEDGLSWLESHDYVDSSRVLLNGWSFGGYMTAYALTHSTKWSAGIAGGTVADWRDYDSVYTERYMLTPQHNPDGYKSSAPRLAAANLHGKLLLLHGTTDDNVHVQNTIQLAYELEKAHKQFRMMLYPKSRHGVTDPDLVYHLRSLMLEFVEEALK